ncbi:MAG: Membrane protein insertase, YidC/Oxa1 family [candidate division WWE3 bacterium GW2011_GWA1_46_21]|uniref:Membrane protein insertase, YidC/Oxa1 family n=4 Tax=Katanobacteria TaxID=422282 RepID=A0A0G1SB40_UNCKA|nr:MAG: Membrane protein insertase, YidC/Oxa1 family [candidate division WWE3 bacterium GW2011_GWA1_46_21]KKU50024.1 MAG: inner membrane protein OxaA, preprotein translocase subunit YidC [candidate division WWE3 bacterium GW2011_GWC1_47_10]KKU57105.1 MAG: Membrane protein insertase, YidC/Oxa1 family [candidate division WWE3 bacterium GW2011_GWB1_47_11]
MFGVIWEQALTTPILNLLVALFHVTNNLGLAIIALTVIMRAVLIPVVLPSMTAMKKQRDLQPQLDKIKKKFKNDKKKQAEAQMELFKQHGLNPAAGCLPQVLMIVILIALYGVIIKFANGIDVSNINNLLYFDWLKFASADAIKTGFLYLDLAKPDPFFILAIVSGVATFISSKMMQPYTEAGVAAAEKTPDKSDDFAYNMQNQMVYTMPIMTVIISLKLPAGAVLYILTTTLFSLVQQYFVSGLGGLTPWVKKAATLWKK